MGHGGSLGQEDPGESARRVLANGQDLLSGLVKQPDVLRVQLGQDPAPLLLELRLGLDVDPRRPGLAL